MKNTKHVFTHPLVLAEHLTLNGLKLNLNDEWILHFV